MPGPLKFEFHDSSGLRLFIKCETADQKNIWVDLACSPAAEQRAESIGRIKLENIEKEIAAIRASLLEGQDKETGGRGQSVFLGGLDNFKISQKSIDTLISCLQKIQANDNTNSLDAIVVGSGASGLASVLALQKRGLKVMLISEMESSAFLHSAGQIYPPTEKARKGLFSDMALYSIKLWKEEYAAQNNLALQERGRLSLAYTKEQVKNLRETLELLQGIYPHKLLSLENDIGENLIGPLVKEKTIFAAWQKDFVSVDPEKITKDILASIPDSLQVQAKVKNIISSDGRAVGVSTTRGDFYADSIIAATGYEWEWLPSENRPPVFPNSGAMLILETEEAWNHLCVSTPSGSIVPMSDSKIWIGVSTHPKDSSKNPSLKDIADITSNATKTCPALSQAKVVQVSSGIKPESADGLPLVGESALPGLFIATGCGRAGVVLMPLVGELIASSLLEEDNRFKIACDPNR